MVSDIQTDQSGSVQAMSLKDAHSQFTRYIELSGKAHATVIAYSKDIEQMVEFLAKHGKQLADEVKVDDIDEFKDLLTVQRYTTKSVSRKVNSIKSFFRYLLGEGLVSENPANTIVHPRFEPSDPRILSKLEYRALRDACRGDSRMAGIVELLLQTGMR